MDYSVLTNYVVAGEVPTHGYKIKHSCHILDAIELMTIGLNIHVHVYNNMMGE